jgi:hypothetical protein
VWTAHLNAAANYTPQVQGPIGSIDYSEDAMLILGSSLGQSATVAIRQDGHVWVAQVGTTSASPGATARAPAAPPTA